MVDWWLYQCEITAVIFFIYESEDLKREHVTKVRKPFFFFCALLLFLKIFTLLDAHDATGCCYIAFRKKEENEFHKSTVHKVLNYIFATDAQTMILNWRKKVLKYFN